MLNRVLSMQSMVAVVGSGCTIPLGYPNWHKFTAGALKAAFGGPRSSKLSPPQRDARMAELEGYAAGLKATTARAKPADRIPPEIRMFYLGVSQRVAAASDAEANPYHRYIHRQFAPGSKPSPKANPCEVLVQLPIHRFVTTNYDCEIERALSVAHPELAYRYSIPESKTRPCPEAERLSFTQEAAWREHQIRFVLAREPGNRKMVFHCHGRFDAPESIIATESDYQRWYVSESHKSFRWTMDLLFGSNPLLFVGYGLAEYDLMQILRQQIGAVGDPKEKHARPIFALLASKDPLRDRHYHAFLYERYGLHVIPFDSKGDRGVALESALEQILQGWRTANQEWLQKPRFKKPSRPETERSRSMLVPDLSQKTRDSIDRVPVADRSGELWRLVQGPAPIIMVAGSSGTGKSWHALHLVKRAESSGSFAKVFYWNTHYANEALTALDLLLEFLGIGKDAATPREQRLRECLEKRKLLIVVDGCERLLRETDKPGTGRAYGPTLRRLLSAVRDLQMASKVVLVGRLWPEELAAKEGSQDKFGRLLLERSQVEDLEDHAPFAPLSRHDRSALVSLLAGHGYGLLLAGQCLERAGPEGCSKGIAGIQELLSSRPPLKRLHALIDRTLDELDRETEHVGRALLDQLSFFQEPVSKATLRECYELLTGPPGGGVPDAVLPGVAGSKLTDLVDKLANFRLVLEVTLPSGGEAYVVHETVRRHLRRRGRASRPVPADFALSGFTATTLGVDPGSEARIAAFGQLFARLCDKIESSRSSGDTPRATALCRDAFGMLRSETDCTAAARWPNHDYDLYMRPAIRLASLVKEQAEETQRWTYADSHDLQSLESDEAPLYVGELAWLYNEVALSLFSEGAMNDAYAVWEQSYEINHVLESTYPYGEYVIESLLGLTHTLLEIGRVVDATEYLERVERLNLGLQDPDFALRIAGYRGLYEHLRGNIQQARKYYEDCIEKADENHRAASFFGVLLGQAEMELDAAEDIKKHIDVSRGRAVAGHYPELEQWARLMEADFQFRCRRESGASREEDAVRGARFSYLMVLKRARGFGIRSLEALAHLKVAELDLSQGDAEGARRSALLALKTANRCALELIATRALITLGQAMVEIEERDLGIAYLQVARRRAQKQQYEHRMREAERRLQAVGVHPLSTESGV